MKRIYASHSRARQDKYKADQVLNSRVMHLEIV